MYQNITLDKSLLGLMSLGQSGPRTTIPWTNVSTPSLTVVVNLIKLEFVPWQLSLLLNLTGFILGSNLQRNV